MSASPNTKTKANHAIIASAFQQHHVSTIIGGGSQLAGLTPRRTAINPWHAKLLKKTAASNRSQKPRKSDHLLYDIIGKVEGMDTNDNVLGEDEVVLDPPPPETMAQKLGLVPNDRKALSQEEWKEVKAQAKLRGDFENSSCAICCQEFKDTPQLLLSCSHSFHRHCIEYFERYPT